MLPNNCKLCLALLISLFSFSATEACGWDPYWDTGFYRFFDPETSELEGYEPFHFTWSLLYDYDWAEEKGRRSDNLKEWQEYLGGQLPLKDIEEVVYKMDAGQLAQYALGAGGGSANQLVRQFNSGKNRDVASYLALAKECEPYNKEVSWWNDDDKRAQLNGPNDDLIQRLQAGHKIAGSDFMKMRYAFQIVRLLHYGGYYMDAINAYESLAEPYKGAGGIMPHWALGQYAGALHGMDKHLTSSYHYSRIFDECPSQRVQAWYSFDVRSDSEWQQVLGMCKTDAERANLYFMRAIQPEAVAIEEMSDIQRLDPGSEKVELLLVREINKLEEIMLGMPYESHFRYSPEESDGSVQNTIHRVSDLKRFVSDIIDGGQMNNPQLWSLADAYLDHLGGNPASARTKLAGLKTSGLTGTRAKLLDLSVKISQVKQVDRAVENDITKDFFNVKDKLSEEQVKEIEHFRDDCFGAAYRAQGEIAKATLALGRTWEIIHNLDLELIEDLLRFHKKDNKTLYEKELYRRLSEAYSKWELVEMKGTALFRKNLLPEAIAVFERLPDSYCNESRFFTIGPNPFANNVQDMINCEPGCIENKFTKLSLARTLLALQEKALKEPEKAGQYNLMLGNAYFNLSYYGACWKGIDYYRGYSFSEDETNVMDLSLAKKYYAKAMNNAETMEIGALACLMSAKCGVVRGDDYIPEYYADYKTLNTVYRDTEIRDMAINECKYFSFYTKR